MIDTSGGGWDNHDAKIDARVIELGMAGPDETHAGSGYYYGDIMPDEWYEAGAVRDLGLMCDGSFRAPAVARAEAALDDARHDQMAARDNRDHFGDRSLPALEAICHANVAVHRAEQTFAEAVQAEAAGDTGYYGGDPRRQIVDDEHLLHASLVARELAEREAEDDHEPEPER